MTKWLWSARGKKNFRTSIPRIYVDASVSSERYGIGVCIMIQRQVFYGMTNWRDTNLPNQNILAEFVAVHIGMAAVRLLPSGLASTSVPIVYTDCKRIHKYLRHGLMHEHSDVAKVLYKCKQLRQRQRVRIVYLTADSRQIHPGYRLAHHLSRDAYRMNGRLSTHLANFEETVSPTQITEITLGTVRGDLLSQTSMN